LITCRCCLFHTTLDALTRRVGGAAEMTGLFHAGDSEITAVDGVSLDDKTLRDAKELLQGPEGTMCKLGCVYGRSKCEWLSLSWAQWCAAQMRVFASLRKNQRLCLVYA
jgi:hypothetical protein